MEDGSCREWLGVQDVGHNWASSLEGSATLTTGMGRGGFGGGGEGRRDDAATGTHSFQGGPKGWGNKLAKGGGAGTIGCLRGLNKIKGSKEVISRVGEVDGVGPGNVLGGIRGGGGWELDAGAVLYHIVGGGGVLVPQRPPTPVLFREGSVSSGEGEEVAVEVASGKVGSLGLREVYLDESKLGAEGSLKAVGNEEELVGGGGDGGEDVGGRRGVGEGIIKFEGRGGEVGWGGCGK